TIRQIPFAGVGDITGRLKANAFSGRLEAGWRMDDVGIRGLALTPFAAFQSQWVFTPRYTESTPNAALAPFALTYSARTNATVRTELGLRTDYAVTKDVALFARAGWAAYLVRDTAITAGFASLPGTSFTATGGRPGPHAAIGSLGFDWRMTPMTTLTARVDGEVSDRHAVANGSLRMQVRF
ncbi:MAG: autotransporter outer membrane beta-barrel domain-containing protein, partial [Alphaproteobacteria bacterium]